MFEQKQIKGDMAVKHVHVLMKKDLEKVGAAGDLIKVSKGYADNFIIPKGYGIIISENELPAFEKRDVKAQAKRVEMETKTSFLAEKIKSTVVVIKEKTHDGNKLYGSIKPVQVAELLKEQGIVVGKSQIEFPVTVKSTGEFPVTVTLSSKLKANFTLKVTSL